MVSATGYLRGALSDKWETTRLWNKVRWGKDNYEYVCDPDGPGSIDEFGGSEEIFKNGERIYHFYYAGGWID